MCLTIYQLLGKLIWILPVFTVFWLFSTFFITYGMAVALNHTYAVFPYISKTGTDVPERGIFTLCVSIGALAMAMNAEMRFQYIKYTFEKMSLTPKEKNRFSNINKTALVLSLLAAFGLLMVASFQVDVMNVPHLTGAFFTFVFGGFCCWLHTAMTYKMYKEERDKSYLYTCIIQVILSVVVLAFFFMFCISFGLYRSQRDAGKGTKWDSLRSVFLTATISEWFLALSIVMFVLTFIPGFRHIEFDGVSVKSINQTSNNVDRCSKFFRCCT